MASEKDQFIHIWEAESATTRKLIAGFPEDKRDFRPHEKSMTARQLAWHLVSAEKFFVEGCLAREFKFEFGPEPPVLMAEILSAFDREHPDPARRLQDAPPAALEGTVKFYVAPRQMGGVPIRGILWC